MFQAIDSILLERSISVPARDGETLFLQGDACNQTLEIRKGIARAVAYSRDGDRQILALFFPGDYVGLPLADMHRYSCEAVSDLRFVRHSSERFGAGLPVHDAAPARLTTAIWKEEEAFIARSLILGRGGVQPRAAAFLAYVSKRLETVDGMLKFSIPQNDIAAYLGTSPETTCRTLRRFRDQGLIAMPRRDRLQILDGNRLGLIAAGA